MVPARRRGGVQRANVSGRLDLTSRFGGNVGSIASGGGGDLQNDGDGTRPSHRVIGVGRGKTLGGRPQTRRKWVGQSATKDGRGNTRSPKGCLTRRFPALDAGNGLHEIAAPRLAGPSKANASGNERVARKVRPGPCDRTTDASGAGLMLGHDFGPEPRWRGPAEQGRARGARKGIAARQAAIPADQAAFFGGFASAGATAL